MSVSHPHTALAIEAARQGLGWEDIVVRYGLNSTHARLIVGVHGGKHGRTDNGPMPEMGSGGKAIGDAGTRRAPHRP